MDKSSEVRLQEFPGSVLTNACLYTDLAWSKACRTG